MSELLINSLEITGYRTFRHLEIPKLGRVNLIVGKNNVGKTALLEAIELYAVKVDSKIVRSILSARDELSETNGHSKNNALHDATKDIKNLFHDRPNLQQKIPPFEIKVNSDSTLTLSVGIRWSRFYPTRNGTVEYLREIPVDNLDELPNLPDAKPLIEVSLNRQPIFTYQLDTIYHPPAIDRKLSETIVVQLIPSAGLSRKEVSDLWDQTALTDAEDLVIESLKMLAPKVHRLNFLGRDKDESLRTPFVKLTDLAEPVQLRSMGEGMNRLLGLSMALTAGRMGLLLVDEVETGFHYSILPQVWKLIFETAAKLNVQVFATTHSWECIEAFQRANAFQNEAEGMLIRLEAKPDRTKVTSFDKERLAIVTREQIEVR